MRIKGISLHKDVCFSETGAYTPHTMSRENQWVGDGHLVPWGKRTVAYWNARQAFKCMKFFGKLRNLECCGANYQVV